MYKSDETRLLIILMFMYRNSFCSSIHLVTVLTRKQLLVMVVKKKFVHDPIVIAAWNVKILICATHAFLVSDIDTIKFREHNF